MNVQVSQKQETHLLLPESWFLGLPWLCPTGWTGDCARLCGIERARGVKAGSWPSSGSPHDLLNCTAVTDPRLRGRRNRKESACEQRQLFGKYKIVRENAGNWFVRGRSRRVAARRCGGARGRSQGCLEFHWVGGVGLTFTHPYPYHIHIHWVRREWQVVPQCFLIFHFDGVGQSTRKVYPMWLIMKPHLSIHVLIKIRIRIWWKTYLWVFIRPKSGHWCYSGWWGRFLNVSQWSY